MLSASAPAGSAIRNTGRLNATCTSETQIGELVNEVISQPVAMFCIQLPVYEMTAAIQRLRNSGSRRGARTEGCAGVSWTWAGLSMEMSVLGFVPAAIRIHLDSASGALVSVLRCKRPFAAPQRTDKEDEQPDNHNCNRVMDLL